MAKAWREVNTTYHGSRNMDPKQQGNYTRDGRLMIGWISVNKAIPRGKLRG